jgi:hypothetical protein
MVYNTQDDWVSGLRLSSCILKNTKSTTFRKLDLLPSSGERGWQTHILFGQLELTGPAQRFSTGPKRVGASHYLPWEWK